MPRGLRCRFHVEFNYVLPIHIRTVTLPPHIFPHPFHACTFHPAHRAHSSSRAPDSVNCKCVHHLCIRVVACTAACEDVSCADGLRVVTGRLCSSARAVSPKSRVILVRWPRPAKHRIFGSSGSSEPRFFGAPRLVDCLGPTEPHILEAPALFGAKS